MVVSVVVVFFSSRKYDATIGYFFSLKVGYPSIVRTYSAEIHELVNHTQNGDENLVPHRYIQQLRHTKFIFHSHRSTYTALTM